MNTRIEEMQREHFNRIAHDYAAHYGDRWSQRYRRRFMNSPMFSNLNLAGMEVLDAMCGSGETTNYLLSEGADVTCVDISQEEIKSVQEKWPSCEARCASILDTGLISASYDAAVVVGGLHHLHPHVEQAIEEIHRLLKKGGVFCFIEPHSGSLPDRLRKLWYRHDKMFERNEESLDLIQLKNRFSREFEFEFEKYKGNIAYVFVLNSLILRIPLTLKSFYSSHLIEIEAKLERLQNRFLSCYVVSRWIKK